MRRVLITILVMTIGFATSVFFARRYMVNKAQMLICFNAGTFNDCKLVSRLKYQRDGYQDSFWIGCMNGLNMADGKGPTKEKSKKCSKQYMKVRDL